ncbi:MAG: UvrD-helicase domain-containing protein [Chlorobi bacterium]|nr:UvrD-helicase domain-containing protein [Chlorobiota bacterium]MCI0715199.1 UvrD-helicase domain-containing protein [Chlorobiota bacterium]
MKNFLIYKASAGSGKTYTLVKEYLKLVLNNSENFRHTLAITFTNKAAEEMKDRIINQLAGLSQGEEQSLKEQLISEGVKGDIKQKAREVLQKILHRYSYFSVTTIDSFFHKVIRSFAKELKLHLGYNVELDQDLVMGKILDELLDEIGENMDLTRYLEDYAFYSIDDNKGWKIEFKIKDIADEIFKERYWIKKGNEIDLGSDLKKVQSFINKLFEITSSFEGQMKRFSDEAQEIINKYNLTISDFSFGKQGFMNYLLNKIRKDDFEPTPRVLDAYNDPKNMYAKKFHPNTRLAVEDGLHQVLRNAVDYYNQNHLHYNTAKSLTKTIHVMGILKDLLKKLTSYRDENRLMLISDTNNILMSVISDDNSPFVYEKIGNVYNNFLIDEFQDTSTFQWKNLKPLVENSLSENNFSMVVGDAKQSIYRWRNGNMMLLLKEIYKDLGAFKESIEDRYLDENFRSKKEIIKFNNEFFKKAAQILSQRGENSGGYLINESYYDVVQKDTRGTNGGYIGISFIDSKDEVTSPKERAVAKTIDIIKESLDEGFKQKDIMILVRENSHGSEIARYLTFAGIRVISNESLLLSNSPKIKILLNLFKYIVDNKNELAKTEVLYNYLTYIKNGDFGLNEIFNDYKKQGGCLFETELPEEFFGEEKGRINSKLFALNIYELAENLISIFGLNKTADSYLLRFLEIVQEYSKKNNSDLTGFLEWWENYKNKKDCSIITPEQEDAVRIMTIHKAKGLESPVVIIPYANWDVDINGMRDLIWASASQAPFNESQAYFLRPARTLKKSYFEKDFSEESVLSNIDNLNLLYVAFTRAEERLYVICPKSGFENFDIERLNTALEGGKSINTAQLVKLAVSRLDFMNSFDAYNYEFGIKSKHIQREPENPPYKIGEITTTDFYKKAVIKPLSSGISLTLQKEKELSWHRNRGIIMHKALEYIKSHEDTQKVVLQLKTEGLVTESDIETLTNELNEIMKTSEVKKWFDNTYEVKAEEELLLPSGEVYRPDRVLLKDNEVIIIDYKTGRQSDEHKKQVNLYAGILEKIGYEVTEKYLFYIEQKEVVKVQ